MRLDEKVVVVAGAGGGLGAAIVSRLVQEGVAALVAGDLNVSGLREQVRRQGYPPEVVTTCAVDVRVADDVDRLVRTATDRYGRVDVMINNAGILSANARLHNLDLAAWRDTVDVNLYGVVNGLAAAVVAMRAHGAGGSVINTASAAGITAWGYTGPYGASKAAVIHLTKIAAVEYARDRIRVNCVCPGTFRTRIHDELPESALKAIEARHPLGLGQPSDIVGAYLYLASDEARWTTGTAVVVDGGYSAP